MVEDLTLVSFVILFATGLCAGFVDAIAGGGGLIALPVLLAIGLPPATALGTNKLQGSFGTLSSAVNFIAKGLVDIRQCLAGMAFTLCGAVLGAVIIQRMDPGFIRHLIPVLLLVVFFYTLFSRTLGLKPGSPKMGRHLFFVLFGLGLGFYDGFFGPGTGSFWTGALLIFLGLDMTGAVGTTRVMNFVSNIVALAVFIMGGSVLWSAGLVMAGGQVIGARAGSSLAIKRGAGFIRPFFLTMVFLTIVRLIYVNYG
ncbi:MAG TPA: TSUP family transporter [Desulfotignum sp.]|nr:TSUP family transporter [Desulfotignum sp.]